MSVDYYLSVFISINSGMNYISNTTRIGNSNNLDIQSLVDFFNQFELDNQIYNDSIKMLTKFCKYANDTEERNMSRFDTINIKDTIRTCHSYIFNYLILHNDYNERCVFEDYIDDIKSMTTNDISSKNREYVNFGTVIHY